MRARIYLDTGTLAKRYLNEARSDDVDAYVCANSPLAISTLTKVEMRCLLARRRRDGCFDAAMENRLYATFRDDLRRGFLVQHAVGDSTVAGASDLVASLPGIPLRTLDALHLAAAMALGAECLVTSDHIMAEAAEALEMDVVTFFPE